MWRQIEVPGSWKARCDIWCLQSWLFTQLAMFFQARPVRAPRRVRGGGLGGSVPRHGLREAVPRQACRESRMRASRWRSLRPCGCTCRATAAAGGGCGRSVGVAWPPDRSGCCALDTFAEIKRAQPSDFLSLLGGALSTAAGPSPKGRAAGQGGALPWKHGSDGRARSNCTELTVVLTAHAVLLFHHAEAYGRRGLLGSPPRR
jgi:hypothetical protein